MFFEYWFQGILIFFEKYIKLNVELHLEAEREMHLGTPSLFNHTSLTLQRFYISVLYVQLVRSSWINLYILHTHLKLHVHTLLLL